MNSWRRVFSFVSPSSSSFVKGGLFWRNGSVFLRRFSDQKTRRCFSRQLSFEHSCFGTILHGRGVIAIEGKDAQKFLQGLTTNDMRLLSPPSFSKELSSQTSSSSHSHSPSPSPLVVSPPSKIGSCIPTCFLNTKGRVIADGLIYQEKEDSYLLEIDQKLISFMFSYLKKFKLRSKVRLEDVSNDFSSFAFVSDSLNAQKITKILNENDGALFGKDPRHESLGIRAILPSSSSSSSSSSSFSSFCQFVPAEYYQVWRKLLGVPEGIKDLPFEKLTPLECSLDHLNYINYSKGCYVGQELTARTHYTGKIRKRLLPVLMFHQDQPQPTPQEIQELQSLLEGDENGPQPTLALLSSLLSPSFELEGVEDNFDEGEREEREREEGEREEGEREEGIIREHRKSVTTESNKKRGGILYSSVFNVGLAMLRLEQIKKQNSSSSSSSSSSFSCGPYFLYPYCPPYLPKSCME